MVRDDEHRLPRESVVPTPETKATMRCSECGGEFSRSEVESAEKGTLACPECGSRDVRDA